MTYMDNPPLRYRRFRSLRRRPVLHPDQGQTGIAVRRLLALVLYRRLSVCFACGRPGVVPCAGHEYGGTILASRTRQLVPWWVGRWVDCRWSW